MTHTEHELESLILGNPLDDSLRVELEELLSESKPDGVDIELLRRERQIANLLESGNSIGQQIHEYKQFRRAQTNYFWDMRGCVNHLFRPFSLWLVRCDVTREFALNIALENKLGQKIDIKSLPLEIVSGKKLDAAFEIKTGIIDFVRRYRGASGHEPELNDDEITITMLPTYSQKKTKPNAD